MIDRRCKKRLERVLIIKRAQLDNNSEMDDEPASTGNRNEAKKRTDPVREAKVYG
jgi:hypothetical protein